MSKDQNNFIFYLFFYLLNLFLLVVLYFLVFHHSKNTEQKDIVESNNIPTKTIELIPTIFSSPTIEPKNTPTKIIKKTSIKVGDTEPWGIARQVGEHTWTMKVGDDQVMATPQEVLTALNEYRKVHGSQNLTWDKNLGDYAQSRADYLFSIKSVDQHKGFNNYLENEDGFNKLGFTWLGENISHGYKVSGVHLIEWIYAGDEPHNRNQLDNKWSSVGIGIKGTATCLIFGTGKR